MNRWPALLTCLAVALSLLGAPTAAQAADDDVVATRAPTDKRQTLVRNKFFYKRGRFEITPQFGYISSSPLNNEVLAGLSLTYHVTDKFGVELNGSYAFLGGQANTKQLAIAVLRLLDTSLRLESVDPGAFVSLSAVFSPMYGKLNPFGLAVINLDFFFVAGVGYGNEQIEMLNYTVDEFNREGAALAVDPVTNHMLMFHLGFGAKIFVSKWFSLKLEGRLYLTWDEVLSYDDDASAAANRNLDALESNRLACHDSSNTGAVCKTVFPTTLVLGVGGSFWLPGDKVVRARMNRR
ncbi:MAG: outer membrane beta-barrel domain-containing protein [Deltaproteobacteria bacterium]|nr:outer membrane beta-barrel domain-containing protein [Deltaproteobacteria bacterium]